MANPAALLAAAEINLRRLRRMHPEGRAWEWLDRWEVLLEAGVEAVLDALTSSAEYAVELRRTSPVRRDTVRSGAPDGARPRFAASRRDRARPMRLETLERVMRAV